MNKIDVTRREFQDSYHRHYKMYRETAGNEKSRKLILFYSVECGLKSLLMKELGKNTYYEFMECCGDVKNLAGHNLSAMLKRLNPQNSYCLRSIQLKNGRRIPPEQFILHADKTCSTTRLQTASQKSCLNRSTVNSGGLQYNEMWRYGATVADENEEEKAEKTLTKIAEWIRTKL